LLSTVACHLTVVSHILLIGRAPDTNLWVEKFPRFTLYHKILSKVVSGFSFRCIFLFASLGCYNCLGLVDTCQMQKYMIFEPSLYNI